MPSNAGRYYENYIQWFLFKEKIQQNAMTEVLIRFPPYTRYHVKKIVMSGSGLVIIHW